MAKVETIATDKAPAAIGPYSQAMRVGNLVFTSGQIPLTADGRLVEGGIEEQTRQVLRNLTAVAESCGITLRNAVKTTCFLKDMNQFAAFNGVYAEAFGDHKPARSTVEVARLPKDVLVEIEVVFALPE
ncbi:RidA family protein [Paenibacillus thermotolerans]|uniref:RidA family protein n=1 Tax=Paenibacillus thermotolerans TaxID=3027807 RepID=UPI002368C4C8|nr:MULTISPECIES: RidA family protein [unclassified Paenibacillus]